MKKLMIFLIAFVFVVVGCKSTQNSAELTPPSFDTGVDSNDWALVSAGEFPYGQNDEITLVDYDFKIMITDVTNQQYADYLNEALAAGVISVGDVDVEAGGVVTTVEGVFADYPGEPFDGYKHEEEITAGDKLHMPIVEEGLRLTFDGEKFSVVEGFSNHPVTMVTWFGANAYCDFYNYRLPSDIEWEKAARGTELIDGYGLPFPWGTEIHTNSANYYTSNDPFESIYGKLGSTTPVGFYNGKTYEGYETLDSSSPYGLYDMAGNVWQWVGDDLPDQHYRVMRGGSYFTYEVDLRVWKMNNAGPTYFSPAVGFRCVQDN